MIRVNAQTSDQPNQPTPIYRVTVIERTTKAINYRYRAEPTEIDFRGTVLLPKAKGRAVVASRQGRTEIDASFEHLTPPTPFGLEYLTYVLWALTPDGRPHNLGEIVTNGRDRGGMRVSTDLQAFALIVTAEPYSAVRQPSDVVVLENQVRPETAGIIGQVNARYELLPRGHYTWQKPDNPATPSVGAREVSAREYEMLLEIYQAQNAIGIARAAHADQLAPDVLAKAETLLGESRQRYEHKGDRTLALQEARESCQTAEDARLIAEQRQRQEDAAQLHADASVARQAQVTAEAAAAKARAEAEAAHAALENTRIQAQEQLEREREARLHAKPEVNDARERAAESQSEVDSVQASNAAARRRSDRLAFRARLLEQINTTSLPAQDTPRGLVVIVPDSGFSGSHLRATFHGETRRLGAALAPYPALHIEVEAHSDGVTNEKEASARARAVLDVLRSSGLSVTARDIGDRRPLGRNLRENRRVEIVISGDQVGARPLWDRTYTLPARGASAL